MDIYRDSTARDGAGRAEFSEVGVAACTYTTPTPLCERVPRVASRARRSSAAPGCSV